MSEAGRQTYQDYGRAAVLAWGGKPTAESLRDRARGLKFFGSVGMGSRRIRPRYYERFPQTYEQGCAAAWTASLTGFPGSATCSTRESLFGGAAPGNRSFAGACWERVVETVKAGADGVHIDEPTSARRGPFGAGVVSATVASRNSTTCVKALGLEQHAGFGVRAPGGFNYRTVLREWLAQQRGRGAARTIP